LAGSLCSNKTLNSYLDLDEICAELAPDAPTWWNPHKSSLGLGNYDVNVIMFALHKHGYETIWFDRRRYLIEFIFHNKRHERKVCRRPLDKIGSPLIDFFENMQHKNTRTSYPFFLRRSTIWWHLNNDYSFPFRDIFETLDPESAFGFILNLPSNWALTRMLPSSLQMKHWIAIKKIGCVYFNLDSKLSEPQPIGEVNLISLFFINRCQLKF